MSLRALLLAILATSFAHAATTGSLSGVVIDRGSDRPLAGVTLTITDLDLRATTDSAGRFAFADLPAGAHSLTISFGENRVLVEETVEAGRTRRVSYRMSHSAARLEATVRGRARKEVVETTVHVEEARHLAGTQGDALKVVQDLPGVARASFGGGDLVVWGAAPADTRIYVDEVEVPLLYHLGGFRSTVSDQLVRTIDFVAGGQGAAWGRGLGGLVRLETRSLAAEGVHGSIGADVLDASALLEAAIGKRFKIAIAGRYSYLDKILEGLVSRNVGDYVPIPRWDDYQLKATLALRAREELSLTFLGSDDRLDRALPSSDPAAVRSDRRQQSFYRGSLRYQRTEGDSSVDATAFVGFDHSLIQESFGSAPTRLGADTWRYGARALGRRRAARWAWIGIGADISGSRSSVNREGSLTLPPREGDLYVFGQPPPGDLSAEKFNIHQLDAAVFAQAELTAGPVTIRPALRAEAVLIEGDHLLPPSANTPVPGFQRVDWALEPRLSVSVRAHSRVTVAAAAGLYHQPPDPADLSVVFGNPRLDLLKAWHLTASLDVAITRVLDAQLAGFVKWLDDLPSRNLLPSPPVGKALVQEGSGRVYGGQLLVRARPWRGLSGWLSYTLSRSERQDHPSSPTRLFDYDQTHVLSLVGSWAWRGLGLGARLRWSSGFPRTPVVGAFWDSRDDQYQPLFGAQNSTRLPDFVELDLRVEYTFQWKRASLNLYLDVENLIDQKNAEEVIYREDYTHRGYVTGLPTTAVLGARVSF